MKTWLTTHKTNTMKTTNSENKEAQQERLKSRNQDQQMLNEVVKGTGMSAWEAEAEKGVSPSISAIWCHSRNFTLF